MEYAKITFYTLHSIQLVFRIINYTVRFLFVSLFIDNQILKHSIEKYWQPSNETQGLPIQALNDITLFFRL